MRTGGFDLLRLALQSLAAAAPEETEIILARRMDRAINFCQAANGRMISLYGRLWFSQISMITGRIMGLRLVVL